MKKILLLLCLILSISLLTGCKVNFKIGNSSSKNDDKDGTSAITSDTLDDNLNNTDNTDKSTSNQEILDDSSSVSSNNHKDLYKNVDGYWVTTSNECYRLDSQGNFYWYKSYDDLTDNYYKGTFDILNSFDAIDELKLNYSDVLEVMTKSNGTITYDDFYCIKAYPTYLISGGIDKSSTNLSADQCFKYLFLKVSDTNAQMINYQTLSTLHLVKK